MTAAIEARDIHKNYGKLKALAGVSLQLHEGECLALLGPNGAGKTTCVEILEGIMAPDRGTVHILGQPLAKHHRKIMELVGVMLQETRLYGKFTVHETLRMFQSCYSRQSNLDPIIARLSLGDKEHSRVEKLSGGQRQRVCLGCALVNDPALLFLDEPTTGLDPQSRRMIWDLLKELKSKSKSILLTTHYMEEAYVLADRVAIIDRGSIIAEGSPDQLIREHCPGEHLVFTVATQHQSAVDPLAILKAELPWLAAARIVEQNVAIMSHDSATPLVQVLITLAGRNGVALDRIEIRKPSLEDVFIKLTGRDIRDA